MNRGIYLLLAHGALSVTAFGFSGESLTKALAPMAQKVSLSVRDLSTGQEVFSHRSAVSMMPASVAKLVSTACSLKTLGPEYSFDTSFLAQGKVTGGTLKGRLVIRGGGDPQYVIEDLREDIERLRFVHGIDTIDGPLTFDVSYLGVEVIPMTEEFEGDAGRSFTAPLTAIPFNFNSFSVWAAPDLDGSGVRTTLMPVGVLDLKLSGSVKLVAGATKAVSLNYDPQKKTATISGSLGRDADAKAIYRSVNEPYEYLYLVFKKLWTQSGGRFVKPRFEISKSPVEGRLLFARTSKSLTKLLIDINKNSLNVGAELALLAAGQKTQGAPATVAKGLKTLSDCLKEWSLDSSIKMTNASGLSRESRLTSAALTQLLLIGHQSFYGPEFESGLPILGADGTLKTRLLSHKNWARLKTDTLRDVRSIAGLVRSKSGKTYAMSMIFNDVEGFSPKLTAIEDAVLKSLIDD